jgi:hypothetical protein
MIDDSYVRSLTAAIKGHIREAELNAIKATHDAEVAKAEAPKLWAELKQWLKEAIAQVSAELPPGTLQYKEDGPGKISLLCEAGKRNQLTVIYVEINGGIAVHGNGFNVEFEPVIEGDEFSYMLSDSRSRTRRKITVEAMGKHVLNAAANYRQIN